ncbi:unnamed protein product [Rhizophagus irregularis]|uniref:Uncharacterized protein n=1 Tax=Rhizophagus irregularis TaxID=588596 RepID=A0A915YYP5_9GLOM|nr:unnamed protein product [Rhizophagus irregularis]CAB5355507.1 unnamed protein product [Rhizophagus irregularis]
MKYFSSSIFQGIIFGWVTSVLIFILLVFVGMWGKIMGLDVVWDLRVGLFLTAVTVITRIISFIACFMMPAILTGMLVLNKIPTLNGSGAMISQLIEASITLSPLCTLKACFNSGKTRKLAIVIASVLVWQYTVSLADLYLHITAVGKSQQLPGLMVPSARSLDIAKNCSFSYFENDCFRLKRGLSYPGRALKIYRNTSDTFQIWNNDDGVYLLQAPPLNTSYAYSGSGILLKPFCEPVGNLTTSQQFALGVASSQYELLKRAVDDVEDVAHSTGNSTLFANAFAQQWAQATIAGFSSGAVQANVEGDGERYGYVLEVIKEQTSAPLSAVLIYAIVITFPLFIFSCVCVFSLQNDTIWILVEFICTPQRLLYQALFKEHHMDDACSKSLSDQAMRIKEVECDVKLEEGHLKLTTKIQ